MSTNEPGLRERKKQATRKALAWAALRLAVERGLDNLLVEDIAKAAGVSPRTYNNYFASKEEAICSIAVDRGDNIKAALLARPADEPLGAALVEAVVAQYDVPLLPARDWVARTHLVMSSPSLRGEFLKAVNGIEDALADAITERLATGNPPDLHTKVLAAAVAGASRVGVDHWLNSGTTDSLPTVVRTAVSQAVASSPVHSTG
jgi:AcrR family transcriptional regulator